MELEKLSLKKDAFRQLNLPLDIRTGVPLPLEGDGMGGSSSEVW